MEPISRVGLSYVRGGRDPAGMSNLVVNDPRFPVGTSVDAVAAAGVVSGLPGGPAIETKVVAADGTLTFTTLVDGVAYGLRSAGHVILVRKGSTFSAPAKWSAVVAARRAAIGTS